jgi:hypothetical protein
MLAGLAISSLSNQSQRFDFRFSQGAFREDELFDSATSVPSRYLLEIGRRMLHALPKADYFAIGNPLLPIGSAQLDDWLVGALRAPAIVTDKSGFPVVYVLPRRLFEEREQLLLLFSCIDSALDRRLLVHLTGVDPALRDIDFDNLDRFAPDSANGWLNPDRQLRVLKLQAEKALRIMDRRADWRDVPFSLCHPDHASDVLFGTLASKQAAPSLYEKQVISAAFKDVVDVCSPSILSTELHSAAKAQSGSISTYRAFANALENLGDGFAKDNYVIYGRSLRRTQANPFHFVDHAKFTLGDPMHVIDRTLYGQSPAPIRLCALPAKPFRILFQLNGDLPLMSYPLESTKSLFNVLRGLGCELSVLDRPDLESAGAHSVFGGNMASLKAQVERHHLFVGVDSTPLHFAKLVMGRPAVALFGCTKACHRDAARTRDYRALVGHLPCNDCQAKSICPMFGGEVCANHAKPQTVASELLEMAFEYYGFSAT